MAEDRVQRRLAAVLAADVVGYSRLMEADEAGTLARLKALRKDLIEPKIAQYGGRVVKLMGDGMLAEFPSVVDAVQCAVEVQREMADRELELPEERRVRFRAGVNLGDVIIDGDDIYGDGVNVAARLEELAEPGGVCVSGTVYEHVLGKLDYRFWDGGEHEAKNIDRPIRVWRWRPEVEGRAREATSQPSDALSPPEKPSIAVLPFTNMSGDPEQDYFADGITEDIITELSRYSELFVIARNSTFAYKGSAPDVRRVARELGVRYVAEGSVRRSRNRMRISIQLIDAGTGHHLWAERYDRELVDIFDLQDEVVQAIVATISGRLEMAEVERLKRKRPESMTAYDCLLEAKVLHHRGTQEDNARALELLDKAIELDPEFAQAYAWKACTLGQAIARGYADDPKEFFERDVAAAKKALALDRNDAECNRVLCEIYMLWRQWDSAELYHHKAYQFNPNDSRIVAQRGELLTWQGRPEEGAVWIEKAMQLDPYGADDRAHLLGRALHAARRYGEAIEAFKRIPIPRPQHHADMAACFARLGLDAEAGAAAAEVLKLDPDFTISAYVEALAYTDEADREHHREGLRKASLPE